MLLLTTLWADHPISWSTGFQDPGTPWMYAIIDLHDRILFYLVILLFIVVWIFASCITINQHMRYLSHGNTIELIWTIGPAIILWLIGIPSLRLLYMMDEILDAELTIKAIGAQWYWIYEYTDLASSASNPKSLEFESFLVDTASLEPGEHRNLHVDHPLTLPVNTSIRLITTSNDVIHSFAVPSLGVKMDAIPGRLNGTGLIITRESTYYGQCSELCGVMHGFMPIEIHAVSLENFLQHISQSD